MIVEDEQELINVVESFLRKESYLCETPRNFYEADETLSIYHYDVALIDITLPGGNGLQLIEKFKKTKCRY